MPVPLAIAAPAAAAGAMYLNARLQLFYDALLARIAITGTGRIILSTRRDRMSTFYVLEDRALASSTANKTLLWFEGKTWTYREAYDQVLRYGQWMKEELGVKKGDIVAVDAMNSEKFIFLCFGLWNLGAKPAFLNYNLKGASLSHCLRVSNTKLCIIDADVDLPADVRAEHPNINFVDLTSDVVAKIGGLKGIRDDDAARGGQDFWDMACLIYTSGTTGMPKPAVVSWAKCVIGGTNASVLLGRKDDIMYTSMPLYHSSALILSFIATLFAGSTQALGRKFSTKLFWKECRESGATNIQYVGETLRYLLAAPPQVDPATGENLDRAHKVTAAFGNGLRPDIWNKFKERFGVQTIVEFYAATEGPFGLWNVSNNDFTMGAMGRMGWLWDWLQRRGIKVVRMDQETQQPYRNPETGFCELAERDEPGEMIFRLPEEKGEKEKRFQGYHGNEKATESKHLRDVFKKGDIWYRSGDLARWDNEGRIFFHDRIGDTFRWKSENVSTSEVSHALGLHPAVREANVYGVALPHHDGRAGCAAVSFDPSVDVPSTMKDLGGFVGKSLPRYAQPLFLRVVKGEMGIEGGQATGTNKQQKHVLREAGVRPGLKEEKELGEVWWLKGGEYRRFEEGDWRELEGGRVKL